MKKIKSNLNLILSMIFSIIVSLTIYHFFNISKYFILIFLVLIWKALFLLFKNKEFCTINLKYIIFSVIFGIIIICSFSSTLFYKDDVLTIRPIGNVSSNEITICNLTSGIKKISDYNLNSDWIINNNCFVYVGKNEYPVELAFNSKDIVKFDLLKSASSGSVKISYGQQENLYNLNSEEEKYINVNLYGTSNLNGNPINLLYIVCLFGTLCIITYVALILFKRDRYSLIIPLSIVYSTLLFYLDYNKCTIAIQFILLLIAYFSFIKHFNDFKKYLTKFKGVLFSILIIIISFLIFGEQLFLSFSDIAFYFSTVNFFLYLLCLIITSLYTFMILSCFDIINKRLFNNENQKNSFWIYFCLSFICLCIWMLAFYPGNYSSDSVSQVIQAITGNINDAHPAIMTLILELIYNIFKSTFAFIVLQCLYFSLTISIILNYLSKKGFSNILLMLISVIVSIFPCAGMNNVTLWKDIIYTISILLLSYYTYRIVVKDEEKLYTIGNILLFVLSFVFVKEFRHNGLVPFAFCSLLYFIISIKRKNLKLGIITFTCIMISTLGIQTLYNLTDVEHSDLNGSIYNSIVKNWGATLYYGKDLSSETNKYLNTIDDNKYFVENYYPNNIDYYFYTDNDSITRWLDGVNNYSSIKIIPLYLKNILKYPGIFIRDRFDSMDVMLDSSFKSYKYPMFVYFNGVYNANSEVENEAFKSINLSDKSDYINHNNLADKIIMPLIDYTVLSNTLALFVWKTGLYFVLYLILIFYLILKKKSFNILALTPIIGNTLSWFLVLNHPSVRYVYYLNISFIFMLLLLLIPTKKERGVKVG